MAYFWNQVNISAHKVEAILSYFSLKSLFFTYSESATSTLTKFYFIAENEAGRLVPDLFLFFKKTLYTVKASGQQLSFNIFW